MPLSKVSRKGAGQRDDSPEAGPSKKDKYSSDEDDEASHRKGEKHQSSKMSKQCVMSKKSPGISKQTGGHGTHNKPAELFRKDLISAMKLADTEILYEDEYVVISDPWRQEWEKGVQVPVNEEEIPNVSIIDMKNSDIGGDFKIPVRKYMHEKNDETYRAAFHELTGMQELAEQIVRYDLDDQDVTWLSLVNEDREEMGLQLINEWNLERMIEELENQCYVKTNAMKKTEEGLGIEYDEDIACDVCRMLESEDTNEMVFCDGCDICVHQACYGIQTIPEGSWLCRICALGIKPMCLLCPKRGGAMKSTRSGTKWTHVSCALWIPEVSIGCPEKMEPITKISNIPASRWALVCCLCKERVGACIQCSVKQCKTAFHVTCGFAHNLDMKTILDDTDELDGIHLRAYCPKHTKNRNASDSESPKKDEDDDIDNENEANEAEMARQRAEKLKQLDEEFYTLVDADEIASKFYIPEEAVDIVTAYWKLKRKINENKPLITPKMEEEDQMQKQQKDSLSARMKMFVHLRQDLERARNLCYMIGKREKTKKQLFNLNEHVFRSQVLTLTDSNLDLSARDADKVRQAYKFDSLYCTLSSNSTLSASSKAPRKNLFTLENLKTPKDFNDGEHVSKSKDKKSSKSDMRHRKPVKTSHEAAVKKEPSMDSASGTSEESSSLKRHREDFKILSDTTADSSEEDFMSGDDVVKSKTDSAQMSRLGKVKAEEIETNNTEEKGEENKPATNDAKTKKIAGSDLKMRLTSILQSKSLMQKQDKLSEGASESFNQALHIDIENSESEVFTDNNTDFASPDQPRNLFDQFDMKASFLGTNKSKLSSPDLPRNSKSSPRPRKKRKGAGCRKHKKLVFINSPSDQSSLSSNSLKQEPVFSTDIDSRSVSVECSSLLSDETEREKSSISPVSNSEASEVVNSKKLPEAVERHRNPSKRRKNKKRSHKRRDGLSSRHAKSIRSSSKQKTAKVSPSLRVDPGNTYGTVEGDIYVPSGKIQVTERIIILDDAKKEKTRVHGKLRLKKQTNSPIKGIVSYEVVNNDFTDAPVTKDDDKKDQVAEDKTESVQSVHQLQDKNSDLLSSSHHMLREKNRKSETRHSRLLSDSVGNVAKVVQDSNVEEINEKDSVDAITEKPLAEKDGASRRSLRSIVAKSQEPYSSDENFVPAFEPPKSPASDRSQLAHKQRSSRRIYTDTEGGDSDSLRSPSPKRKTSRQINSNPVIKINPFPNRPELNALLDSSKLVVKDAIKSEVGDRLSHMLKRRGRWGNRCDVNQLTLDGFVKPVKRSENVFAKVDLKTVKEDNESSVSSPNLRTSASEKMSGKSTNSLVSSSISLNLTANGTVFGVHSSPRRGLTPGKMDENNSGFKTGQLNADSKGDIVLWEVPSENSQTSFKELRTRSPFKEEVKTPSKCDQTVINNDCLEVSHNYRSHSPLSSEGSEASSRNNTVDSREGTPRRSKRMVTTENSQSPVAPGRLRNRDGLTKPSPFKNS